MVETIGDLDSLHVPLQSHNFVFQLFLVFLILALSVQRGVQCRHGICGHVCRMGQLFRLELGGNQGFPELSALQKTVRLTDLPLNAASNALDFISATSGLLQPIDDLLVLQRAASESSNFRPCILQGPASTGDLVLFSARLEQRVPLSSECPERPRGRNRTCTKGGAQQTIVYR